MNSPIWLTLVLLSFGAIAAFAQGTAPQTCAVSASIPPELRAEGLTELLGDILLTCTGGAPTNAGQPIPQANVTIFLNTNVTNRTFANGGSDALLLIDDEPASASTSPQQLCGNVIGCVVLGTGGLAEPFSGVDASRPNIFQGMIPSNNSVTFAGIPVDPPGTGKTRTYRITNVRANANTIGVFAAGVPLPVIASISTSLPISSAQVTVGVVLTGLTFSAGAMVVPECLGILTGQLALVQFTEAFPTAFRPQAPVPSPGTGARGESGFIFSGLPGGGLADSGTRMRAVFSNIPAGVAVFVSTNNIGAPSLCANAQSPCAQLTASEIGPYMAVSSTTTFLGIPAVQLPVVNGVATAVWEVALSTPTSLDSYSFGVFFTASGKLGLSTPPALVNGSLAPAPPAFSASDGAKAQPSSFPVPRFADTSIPATILSVSACQTDLLFPFVTNQAGFDTGLTISNTTRDPFGTPAQSGRCALNFYGANSPATISTPPVASGTTYTTLVSGVAPNFQGYVIAICNFQFAHAFAAITDATRALAMAYLGLVIPLPPRDPLNEVLVQ